MQRLMIPRRVLYFSCRAVRNRALARSSPGRFANQQSSTIEQPSTSTSDVDRHEPRKIARDLYPSPEEEKELYKSSPILEPSQDIDPESELSEGANLWFANLIKTAEQPDSDIDLGKSLSPYADAAASFAENDGADLPPVSEMVEGQVFPLKEPVDAPTRVPQKKVKFVSLGILDAPCL